MPAKKVPKKLVAGFPLRNENFLKSKIYKSHFLETFVFRANFYDFCKDSFLLRSNRQQKWNLSYYRSRRFRPRFFGFRSFERLVFGRSEAFSDVSHGSDGLFLREDFR